jgi:L-aspartate oxidase
MTNHGGDMEETVFSPRYILPFDTRHLPHLFSDILVLGSGAAGLRAAAAAAPRRRVLVVTKGDPMDSNTSQAQGGVASVLDSADSFDRHLEDTLLAGDGLCDRNVAHTVIREGPDELRLLEKWGLRFDRENGRISLTREGGHSRRRVAHAGGDATGLRISDIMLRHVKGLPAVSILENCFAVDLLTDPDGGRVLGAVVIRADGELAVIRAGAVILASGGLGRIFQETTNPDVATGDGMAMAYRAGAQLRDLEFVQFHPTSLYLPGADRFLITEAVRGEGGVLRDKEGCRFMPDYHPRGELAPRDVVSRAILAQMKKTDGACVYLDLTAVRSVDPVRRFPNIAQKLLGYNIHIARDLIPVRPSAHYLIGGVAADLDGRTTLDGLFVCGEAASTGLHGANRLGSNSLLEALVTGRRAGRTAAEEAREGDDGAISAAVSTAFTSDGPGLDLSDVENSVRSLVWRRVGIERNGEGLLDALEKLAFWSGYILRSPLATPRALELKNMITLARLAAKNALRREETRGVHFRADFPTRDDEKWGRHNDCDPMPASSSGTGGDLG